MQLFNNVPQETVLCKSYRPTFGHGGWRRALPSATRRNSEPDAIQKYRMSPIGSG